MVGLPFPLPFSHFAHGPSHAQERDALARARDELLRTAKAPILPDGWVAKSPYIGDGITSAKIIDEPPPFKAPEPGALSKEQIDAIVGDAMQDAGLTEKPEDKRARAHKAIEADSGVYCRPSVLAFAIKLERHLRAWESLEVSPAKEDLLFQIASRIKGEIERGERPSEFLVFRAAAFLHFVMKEHGLMAGTRAVIDEARDSEGNVV
jgi:hypothetical protein